MTLNTEDERFFVLTKKIHNYIHGTGPDVDFSDQDREVYESVGRENAESEVFQKEISNGDIIGKCGPMKVIHEQAHQHFCKPTPSYDVSNSVA